MIFKRPIINATIILVLLATMIGISGCFSSNPKDIEAFMKPSQTSVTSDRYVLQPPDEIEVHCARIPEINMQRQRVRPDGRVSFENVGDFMAAGRTPEELASDMKKKVSTLYMLVGEEPIEVRIIAFKSKMYYVLGQVYVPGPKVFSGRDSVLTAVADAQPNPMAWLDRVQVIRPSAEIGVRPRIFEVDFDRMAAHGDTTKNVLLQEGDVIYVPPTVLAWVGLKIEELIRPIARAFAGVSIVQNPSGQYVGGYDSGGGSGSYYK